MDPLGWQGPVHEADKRPQRWMSDLQLPEVITQTAEEANPEQCPLLPQHWMKSITVSKKLWKPLVKPVINFIINCSGLQ